MPQVMIRLDVPEPEGQRQREGGLRQDVVGRPHNVLGVGSQLRRAPACLVRAAVRLAGHRPLEDLVDQIDVRQDRIGVVAIETDVAQIGPPFEKDIAAGLVDRLTVLDDLDISAAADAPRDQALTEIFQKIDKIGRRAVDRTAMLARAETLGPEQVLITRYEQAALRLRLRYRNAAAQCIDPRRREELAVAGQHMRRQGGDR